MNLEEAIKKVEHYWYTGMDGYFTYDEIFELGEMLIELKERRGQEDSCIGKCKQGRIDWLNQEVEDND